MTPNMTYLVLDEWNESESPLFWYDPDHNDPPADLCPEAYAWLARHAPSAKLVHHRDYDFKLVIKFDTVDMARIFASQFDIDKPTLRGTL